MADAPKNGDAYIIAAAQEAFCSAICLSLSWSLLPEAIKTARRALRILGDLEPDLAEEITTRIAEWKKEARQ